MHRRWRCCRCDTGHRGICVSRYHPRFSVEAYRPALTCAGRPRSRAQISKVGVYVEPVYSYTVVGGSMFQS